MTDIHSHLLFGVDDGAKTLEESIEMLKMGKNLGFSKFVLTSHFGRGDFYNNDYNKNFEILLDKVKELNLEVELLKGNEIYLNEDMLEVFHERHYNLIDKKYILIEFPPMILPEIGIKMIERILSEDIILILAHIERYMNFKEKDFLVLKEMGVRLQINIRGRKTKEIEKMLQKGKIDFLGSDAHRIDKRGYDLKKELNYIKNMIGENRVYEMTSLKKSKGDKLGDEKKKNYWILFVNFFENIFSGTWVTRDFR